MSWRLLADPNGEVQHVIQDDMESLLYVVLYCALHWLPHNLNKKDLSDLISLFFDYRQLRRGGITGGTPKLLNSERRHLTGPVAFTGKAIQEWLDTVMNFNGPPRDSGDEYKDKWYLDQLDAYWSDFLRTRALEHGDRVLNEVEKHPGVLESFISSMLDDDSADSSVDSPRSVGHSASSTSQTDESDAEPTVAGSETRITGAQGVRSASGPTRTRTTQSMPQNQTSDADANECISHGASELSSPSPAPEVQPIRTNKRPRQTSPAPTTSDNQRHVRHTRSRPGPREETLRPRSERIRKLQERKEREAAEREAAERQALHAAPSGRGRTRGGASSAPVRARARPSSASRSSGGRGGAAGSSGHGDGGKRGRGGGRPSGRGDGGTKSTIRGRGRARGRGARTTVSRK